MIFFCPVNNGKYKFVKLPFGLKNAPSIFQSNFSKFSLIFEKFSRFFRIYCKIVATKKYPEPTNLKELRALLGLSGYYRRFVKGYAKIAKPLTYLLRREEMVKDNHIKVTKHNSKTFKVKSNPLAKDSFELLKKILTSKDVLIGISRFPKTCYFDDRRL